jgi:hypothetical protein
MWIGPLHERSWLLKMSEEAESRSWTGHSFESSTSVKLTGHNPPKALPAVLKALLDESNPRLPPWYFHLREISTLCGKDIPARDRLVSALQQRGFAACRSHVEVWPHMYPTFAAISGTGMAWRVAVADASCRRVYNCATHHSGLRQFQVQPSACNINDSRVMRQIFLHDCAAAGTSIHVVCILQRALHVGMSMRHSS